GLPGAERGPLAVSIPALQSYRHTRCRRALGRIQNVRGNAIHCASHFFIRICIIFRCSSTACCNSVASSLCNRRRRISRISLADFPVAQTIKNRPNFCSYSRLPHFSAVFTASSAAAAFCCSCADQAEDCAGGFFSACDSPIRGLLPHASSQSGSPRLCQITSDVATSEASSWIGLF